MRMVGAAAGHTNGEPVPTDDAPAVDETEQDSLEATATPYLPAGAGDPAADNTRRAAAGKPSAAAPVRSRTRRGYQRIASVWFQVCDGRMTAAALAASGW
jgi:hypothetical protein